MTNSKICVYYSSDYAGIDFDGGGFYYGYETTKCNLCGEIDCADCTEKNDYEPEWCFVASDRNTDIITPKSELGCKNENAVENLLYGIAVYMESI